MKAKLISALLLCAAIGASAQGYKDGVEYYKAGQYDNAITILERNISDASTNKAMAYYYLGQSYLAKGDKTSAKSYFDKGLTANASCGYNYIGIGALDLQAGNESAAKDNFKKAQSYEKKNAELLVDIVRAYYKADPVKYAKDIEEYLKKAYKTSKNNEPAIYIFEGDRLAAAKDWNKAATMYEQAIYFDEDNPEGYVKYANVYFNTDGGKRFAIQKLVELLQKNPSSALGQRELAEKYYEDGQWTEAAKQYGQYIANPNHFPEDKERYAVLLFTGNNYQKAYDIASEILRNKPGDITLQRIVVRSLDALNRDSDALQETQRYFENAANANKFNAADYKFYATLLTKANQDSLAVVVLQKGAQAFPEDGSILKSLSDAYWAKKEYKLSAEFYNKYLGEAKDPQRSDYYTAAKRLWVVSTLSDNDTPEERAQQAQQGLDYMDKVLADIKPEPTYLRWKALLYTAKNGNKPDENTVKTYEEIIGILDQDPANADPANKDNYLDYYVEAYHAIAQYYLIQKDTAAFDEAKAQMDKYKNLAGTK